MEVVGCSAGGSRREGFAVRAGREDVGMMRCVWCGGRMSGCSACGNRVRGRGRPGLLRRYEDKVGRRDAAVCPCGCLYVVGGEEPGRGAWDAARRRRNRRRAGLFANLVFRAWVETGTWRVGGGVPGRAAALDGWREVPAGCLLVGTEEAG